MKCEGYASETYGECKGEATKRVLIGTLPFHLCETCYGRLRKDLGVRKNPYSINEDRFGDIIISHPQEKNTVFLQAEADKELITDLLRKSEKEELNEGWDVEIGDDEPRASILGELFEAQRGVKENPTLIIAKDGTIHRKTRGKKAVPVCTGSYPDKKRGEQLKVTVNPEGYDTFDEMFEGGKPVKGVLKSYYCEKCKRRHFSGTRTFDAHFEYARLTL